MSFWRQIPKDKLQKLVLSCLVALTITGLVVQFYTLKQLRDLSEYQSKIAALRVQISETESAARRAAQVEPVRKQLQAFVEAQQARMVDGDPFAWAVRELTLVAERHPVRILNWQLGAKGQQSKKPTYSTVTIRLDISGRYDEIGRLIEDLENKFPAGQIRSLNMGSAQADTGVHQVAVEFALLVRPAEKLHKATQEKTS